MFYLCFFSKYLNMINYFNKVQQLVIKSKMKNFLFCFNFLDQDFFLLFNDIIEQELIRISFKYSSWFMVWKYVLRFFTFNYNCNILHVYIFFEQFACNVHKRATRSVVIRFSLQSTIAWITQFCPKHIRPYLILNKWVMIDWICKLKLFFDFH